MSLGLKGLTYLHRHALEFRAQLECWLLDLYRFWGDLPDFRNIFNKTAKLEVTTPLIINKRAM